MDILEYLEADQDAMKQLIAEFKTAESESTHEAEAFTALVAAMKIQFEAQKILFTQLTLHEDLMAPSLERMLAASEVEKMIECCSNRATWRASVNVLCELLETEIDRERHTLFPAIFDDLDCADRRRLGQTYRKLRGFSSSKSSGRRDPQSVWSTIINQAG